MTNSLTPPGTVTRVTAERVLVLAPHQDDELLGCGGLLRCLIEQGASVTVLFMSNGAGGVENSAVADEAACTEHAGRAGTSAAGASVATAAIASKPNASERATETDDREHLQDYAHRRRTEAEAVATLAGWETRYLELEDGQLSQNMDAMKAAIRETLGGFEPDLLLAPGPLELTPDHVACFRALFEALNCLRPDDALHQVAATCRYFLYSVNHPGYANLLVDVSEQLPFIEQAMALYESQLDLHNYTLAGVGLRRFRTHSLGVEVEAAEGFVELALDDFSTHSLASLEGQLGAPAVRARSGSASISLIVRTFNRPELLCEALLSVAANSCLPKEVILVNDGGDPPASNQRVAEILRGFPTAVNEVNLEQNQGRAAAANAGLAASTADYVAFLDDDDLLYPEHFQLLTSTIQAAGVKAVYSDAAVTTYRLSAPTEVDGRDGGGWDCVQRGLPYSRDFDLVRLHVDNYIPFHTLLIERTAAQKLGFDESLASFEDWDFILRLAQRVPLHHVRRTTCEYRHFEGSGHHALGALEDSAAEFIGNKAKVLAKHRGVLTDETLARAVTELRRETVERELEVKDLRGRWQADRRGRAEASQQASALRQALVLAEDRYHREHGEVEALRAEEQRLRERILELGREASEAAQEVGVVRRQLEESQLQTKETSDHVGRTYAEIERLMALIEAMEGTRAWRLHRLLQRPQKS